MSELLPALVVEPEGPVTGSVIWLHGLGADGYDFEPVLPYLPLSRLGVRVVLPHAPSIPVSLNQGFVMPAWYDIRSGDLRQRHDEAGIRESARRIEDWVAAERAKGIPNQRIALAGFSQGGAIALHVGLRYPEPLAGIVALSTYLLLPDALEAEASAANARVPVFQAHGTLDPMVTLDRGQSARDALQARGHEVTYREYRMEHAVDPQELRDLGAWLEARFGGAETAE